MQVRRSPPPSRPAEGQSEPQAIGVYASVVIRLFKKDELKLVYGKVECLVSKFFASLNIV